VWLSKSAANYRQALNHHMNPYKYLLSAFRKSVSGAPYRFTYAADGFGVRKKYIPFLNNSEFKNAWDQTRIENDQYWGGETPDIRWRCHVCAWAASNALRLEGDFAEFGVNTGMLSSMAIKTTDFVKFGKTFFLFDTFEGIPEEMMTEGERSHARILNKNYRSGDILGVAKRIFAPFDNIEFVVGMLPGTIAGSGLERLCYVSIDLNSVTAEMAVIEEIWDRITPGGFIVLDDYGFGGHEEQNVAWNDFAQRNDRSILALPTGQGLLIR
jgi:O-methyltransferase